MVFSSVLFLYYFLPPVFITYFITPKRFRNLVLFIFSLFFYAWGEPKYIWIMLFSTVLDYTCGKQIRDNKIKGRENYAKLWLLLSVVVNIGLLAFFNKNMEHIREFIQKIKELDENIKLGALLIPSKDSVHSNLLPEYAPTLDEKEIMGEINKQLAGALNIVELMDILNENSKDYIYYKTDHHWTTKGAYYGYLALSDFLGYNPYLEEEFNIQMVSDSFLGTIYRKANLYKGEGDKIFKYSLDGIEYSITINEIKEVMSLYDDSYLEKVDKYSYFLGGDYGIVDINTNIDNDKTLVIIKDSFANSIIPFLSLHYERIILLDTRYFGGSIPKYIKDLEVDEILFMMNIQNFSQMKSLNVLSR